MSLLEAGTSVNLCFLMKKKCFAERFSNLLLNPYLKVGWKEKERERDISSLCVLMNVPSLALELEMANLFS